MNEFFQFETAAGDVIRVPFPPDLPLDERETFMADEIAAHSDTPTED